MNPEKNEGNSIKDILGRLDRSAGEKGSGFKTLWQLVKFLLVSGICSIIQLVLVNLLFFALRSWKAPLPDILSGIFSVASVGEGNDNWGYVLPFFLSNLIANIYGYIRNKKTTFRSDAPGWCFGVYLVVLMSLIFFSTWLQGRVANLLLGSGKSFLAGIAPTAAAACAGFIQMVVLFPLEKFILLKEKIPDTVYNRTQHL